MHFATDWYGISPLKFSLIMLENNYLQIARFQSPRMATEVFMGYGPFQHVRYLLGEQHSEGVEDNTANVDAATLYCPINLPKTVKNGQQNKLTRTDKTSTIWKIKGRFIFILKTVSREQNVITSNISTTDGFLIELDRWRWRGSQNIGKVGS